MSTSVLQQNIVRICGKQIDLCVPRMDDTDLMKYCHWVNNINVAALIGRSGIITRPELLKDSFLQTGRILLNIARKGENSIIGFATIDYKAQTRTAVLGVVIGEQTLWNKGYGSEVTQLLVDFCRSEQNAHRIVWISYSDNPYAIKCAQSAGFRICVVEHESEFHHGNYHDRIILEIICNQ